MKDKSRSAFNFHLKVHFQRLLKQPKKFQRYKIFPSLRFKASGSSGFAFCLALNAG
jgi:hypothetical protein